MAPGLAPCVRATAAPVAAATTTDTSLMNVFAMGLPWAVVRTERSYRCAPVRQSTPWCVRPCTDAWEKVDGAVIVSRLPAAGPVPRAPSRVLQGDHETLTGGPAITPYQIMIILSTEADSEQHDEAVARVRALVEDAGGTVDDIALWGRRKIAYPVRKQADGVYVVVTCQTTADVVDEIGRVLAISKDVVLRAMPFRLTATQLEAVHAGGVPLPVDDRPEESRQRGGGGRRGGGGGGGRRRDR